MTAAELKALIQATGLDRHRVAERLGVNHVTVWRWVSGRTPISRQVATYIKTTFGTVTHGR